MERIIETMTESYVWHIAISILFLCIEFDILFGLTKYRKVWSRQKMDYVNKCEGKFKVRAYHILLLIVGNILPYAYYPTFLFFVLYIHSDWDIKYRLERGVVKWIIDLLNKQIN